MFGTSFHDKKGERQRHAGGSKGGHFISLCHCHTLVLIEITEIGIYDNIVKKSLGFFHNYRYKVVTF